MRHLIVALLAGMALTGCSRNTGVETTPTFSAARHVPQLVQPTAPRGTARPDRAPAAGRSVSGLAAVAAANRGAAVTPDSRSMRGGTWFIDAVDPTQIYVVPTKPNHVTTILLPPGERFNGAVGGDVESFLINVAYAGPRPAVSILPRSPRAKGNLQLVTTGGFYSFELQVNRSTALNLADIDRQQAPALATSSMPQPEGDFTRLLVSAVDGPAPAWAPVEAWADSRKMVIRFDSPQPQLPALFAGQKGEQLVNYRSQHDATGLYLITDRRVTEAELRLDEERLRLTVDPAAIAAGAAADAAKGWKPAGTVPDAPPANNVAVLVVPGNGGAAAAVSTIPGGTSPRVREPDIAAQPGWM